MSALRAVSENGGRRHAGDERDIGGLEAAIGEVDGGRRLRGAAHADQDYIGFVEIVRQVPVIVEEGEVHGVDALEIFRVQHVLRTGPRRRMGAEIGREQGMDRLEHREMRRARVAANLFQPVRQVLLDQGVQHDAGRGFDLADHALELGVRTHEGIDMLDGGNAFILRDGRAGDGDERFARRVGDEMEMEIAASHGWYSL